MKYITYYISLTYSFGPSEHSPNWIGFEEIFLFVHCCLHVCCVMQLPCCIQRYVFFYVREIACSGRVEEQFSQFSVNSVDSRKQFEKYIKYIILILLIYYNNTNDFHDPMCLLGSVRYCVRVIISMCVCESNDTYVLFVFRFFELYLNNSVCK